MPRNNENQHVEATPHFDGKRESIINDATASAGEGIGITFTKRMEFALDPNPYNAELKENEDFKKLKKIMGGETKE
ncbi:hypothetical protein ACIQ34_15285 [Ureibacillus sp. NPDC094379]